MATRAVAVLLWAAVWAVVLAFDADFDGVWYWLLVLLLVVPQLALGYVAGPWAILLAVPLTVVWAPLAEADCATSGAECVSLVMPALGLGATWAIFITCGFGLRLGFTKWRDRHSSH